MPKRQLILITIAAILIGLAVWVNLGSGDPGYRSPVLSAADLATLTPDLASDRRLLEELRRQAGLEPDAWKTLPEAGRVLYATLWAEDIHRTLTWSQMTTVDIAGLGLPNLGEVAAAYETLGRHDIASGIRALEVPFNHCSGAFRAWVAQARTASPLPRPTTRPIDAAAPSAFAGADGVRAQRLEYLRDHTADLGIH